MKILLSIFIALLLGYSALAQTVTKTVTKTIVQGPAPVQNGSKSPDFTVTSIDGKTFDSNALRGKVVVLNLWFVNCPFCVQEIALLNPIVDQYKEAVFIGMAVNNKPQLESFLKNYPFKYNIIPNAGQIMLFKFGEVDKNGNYDLKFPLHVVIDRQGNQVLKMQGIKGVDAVRQELEKQFKQ
ncbi:MAG TPA: TlpA disulfide reductase family protein [Pyrinomonadaceae bacterium]|jgi:peroxiredoxin|nr:TlpA disulfide reductase family protein [Pyrinomonadaceae bacterium]